MFGGSVNPLNALNVTWQIKRAISSMYIVLRNLAASIMLAGLIFIGIKILASSNHPQKKAQWTMYLTDWVVGLALLIFMHVMMIGIFYVSDTVTEILASVMFGTGGLNFSLLSTLVGSWTLSVQVVGIIMLGYMIYLTVIFAIAYFKRMLWMSILIVFAPVMAVMYSFGSATKQIFSRWMKDYIMTVMVQPFHMLVYSVLISLPMQLAGFTSNGIDLGSLFMIFYALGAMAFIRPAEKYLRSLFGMDQGLAAMASYDSGKKTLGAIVSTVASVVPAGKAASMAMKVAGKANGAMGGIQGLMGKGMEKMGDLGGGGKAAKDAGDALSNVPLPEAQVAGQALKSAGDGEDGINEATPKTQLGDGGMEDIWSDSSLIPQADNSSTDGGTTSGETTDNAKNTNENGVVVEDSEHKPTDQSADAQRDAASSMQADLMALLGNAKDGNNINANTVNINANNINMKDAEMGPTGQGGQGPKLKEGDETSEKDGDNSENNDGNVEITNPGEDAKKADENKRKGLLLGNFMAVATGQKGIMETLDKKPKTKIGEGAVAAATFPYRLAHKGFQKMSETKGDGAGARFVRKIGDKGVGIGNGLGNIKTFLTEFEKQGGMQKLHAGFNQIRDTMYVGGAPGDWQDTNKRMDERNKKSQEERKREFVDVHKNEWLISDFEAKLKLQYPDKSQEYIREKAQEKAKEKLNSLATTYMPLGVLDAKLAYMCDKDCKKYGYSPEQSVQQVINFTEFDKNPANVTHMNATFTNNDGSHSNYTSVSEAVGSSSETREYYNNGYTKIEELALVQQLTHTLGVSINKGMQLDQALRRKGGDIKIDFKKAGLSDENREQLNKIMEQYKKIQNGDKKD